MISASCVQNAKQKIMFNVPNYVQSVRCIVKNKSFKQ